MEVYTLLCAVVWWLLGIPGWFDKQCIKEDFGRAFITMASLQTLTVEIEAHLNNRQLTYVNSELNLSRQLIFFMEE